MPITVKSYGEDFDKYLDKELSNQTVGVEVPDIGVVQSSVRQAKKQNPEAFAKAVDLSEQTGIPSDVVNRNMDKVELDNYLTGLDKHLANSPILSKSLLDPQMATLAQDDIESLSLAENSLNFLQESANQAWGNTVEGAGRIYDEYSKSVQSLTSQMGFNPAIRWDKEGMKFDFNAPVSTGQVTQGAIDYGKEVSDSKAGYVAEYTARRFMDNPSVENAAGFIAEQGPGALVYMLMSRINPTLTTVSFGEGIAEYRAKNNNREKPNANDLSIGLIGGYAMTKLEQLQADMALKGVAVAKRGLLKDIALTAVSGGMVEGVQTGIQLSGGGLNTDKGVAKNSADQFKESVVGGALIEGGIRTATGTVENGPKAVKDTKAILDKALNISVGRIRERSARGSLDEGVEAVKNSKLRQRSPKKLEELADKFAQGAEMEIEPEALQELFQTAPELVDNLEKYAPEVLAEAKRSMQDGSNVVIPISKYMVYFADQHEQLSDFIKVTPDGLTAKEAEAQVARIFEQSAAEQVNDGREQVKQDMFGQLKGIQGDSNADTNAEVYSRAIRTLAERAGMTPTDLAKAYKLDISRYTPESLRKPEVQDNVDLMIDRLRNGDIPTEKDAKGQPVLEFLRSIGGLKDDGGELSARDLNKKQEDFGKLSQPEGLDFDTAIQKLIDAGYVNSDTGQFGHNELMDLIDNALQGNNQYSSQNQNDVVNNQREALNELERHLNDLGLDINSMTNDEIRAALYGNDANVLNQSLSSQESDFDKIVAEAEVIDPKDLVGKTVIPTLADLTGAGIQYTGIDSSGIDSPIELQGGPKFPMLDSYNNNDIVWAVNDKGGLTNLQKADYVVVSAMSEDTHRSNATVGQAFLSTLDAYVRDGRISEENLAKIDDKIRHGNKAIEDVKALGYEDSFTVEQARKFIQKKATKAKSSKIPSAVRNAIGKALFKKYKDGEKLTTKEWGTFATELHAFMSDRTFASFPGLSHVDTYHDWIEGLTFNDRAALTDVLVSKSAQALGVPNFQKILRKTLDKDFAGNNFGDALLVLEVDKGGDARVELGKDGTKKHRSYKYGVKGRVVGKFARPVSIGELYPDFVKSRRDAGADVAGDRRSFQLSLPKQTITEEIAAEIAAEPYVYIKTPKQAQAALDFKNDNWKTSADSVKNGGVSTTDFTDALASSDSSASLTIYTPSEVNAAVKKDAMSVYKLGNNEIYFALKKGYNYNEEYGVDLEAAGLTADEVAVVGVVNNEVGAPSIAGPSVMLKAISEGATVLDAFSVKSDKFPHGFLPEIYGQFGFEAVAEVDFDPQYYSESEIADLELLWSQSGWNKDDGYPSVSVMKWRGSDEQRATIREEWLKPSFAGFDNAATSVDDRNSKREVLGWRGETGEKDWARERDSSNGTGSVRDSNAARITSRLRGVIEELSTLSEKELSNLGVTQSAKNTLFQESRGSLQFNNPKDGFKLELTPNADHSTFVHELAHYYFEVSKDLAKRTNAPEIQADLDALNKWHKSDLNAYREELRTTAKARKSDIDIDSLSDAEIVRAIDSVSDNQDLQDLANIASHERFARGFEAYLSEGKSPTPELAGVYARFFAWLKHVYKSMKDLNIELSDDVRNVYDRMLATQEEIDNAKEMQGYRMAVQDYTDLGVSKSEAQRITALASEAEDEVVKKMAAQAYDEAQRSQKKWWKEERARITKNVEQEIKQKPVYQAIQYLQGQSEQGADAVRMSKQAIVDEFGKDFLKRLPRGKRAVYADDGVHPSQIAMQFGYMDYNEMLVDMVNAKPMKKVIADQVTGIMESEYGNMLSDGSLKAKAMDMIHSEAQAKALEAEENALAVSNKQLPTKRQLVKEAAEAEIGAMKVREIRPFKYQQAEAKYGRMAFEAGSKGDYVKALEYKRLQIANFERFKIATKRKDQAEKIRARLDKYTKPGTARNKLGKAGEEYLDAVDEILDRIEFKKSTSLKKQDRRTSLNAFIKEQADNGFEIDIPNEVIEDAKNLSFKNLTFDKMVEIDLAVQQIAHLARTKNKLMIGQQQRDFAEVKMTLLNNIKGKSSDKKTTFADDDNALFSALSSIDAVHAKPEFMFTQMDGEKNGVWWGTFFKPLRQAMNREVDRQAEYAKKTKEIFSVYSDKELMREKVEFAGKMITRDKLLSLALNYGNENNKNRLYFTLESQFGLSAAQVDAELMRVMTERDWKATQEVWNMIDEFWPEIKESERQRTGKVPEKVQAEKITTPFGTISGGYYPIKYDAKTSFKQQIFDDKANLGDVFANSSIAPTTAKGHREARVKEVKRELKLELSVLDGHVAQVIHDLEFFDTLRSLDKLLLDDEINTAMNQVIGNEKLKLIRPFLADVGRGNSATKDYLGWFDRAAMALRRNATMVNMGFKVTTAIQQPLGMTQTFAKIGLKYSVKEAMEYWSNPVKWKSTADEVFAKSSMLRNRTKSYDREVNDVLRQAEKRAKGVVSQTMGGVEKHAYTHIAMLDLAVSIPTWKAAYRKGLAEGKSEQEAIDYAESILAQTQSSGEIIDLAAIQRNTNTIKLFTMFYSYFSSMYNMSASAARKTGIQWSEGHKAQAIGYAMFAFTNLIILPAILAEYLVGRGPDDDEDWGKWAANKVGVYPFMGLVAVRDIVNGIAGDYGYAMTPIEGSLKTAIRATKGAEKVLTGDDLTEADAKNMYLSLGYLTGMPVFNRQGWITLSNILDISDSEDLSAYEALMIKEHKN